MYAEYSRPGTLESLPVGYLFYTLILRRSFKAFIVIRAAPFATFAFSNTSDIINKSTSKSFICHFDVTCSLISRSEASPQRRAVVCNDEAFGPQRMATDETNRIKEASCEKSTKQIVSSLVRIWRHRFIVHASASLP